MSSTYDPWVSRILSARQRNGVTNNRLYPTIGQLVTHMRTSTADDLTPAVRLCDLLSSGGYSLSIEDLEVVIKYIGAYVEGGFRKNLREALSLLDIPLAFYYLNQLMDVLNKIGPLLEKAPVAAAHIHRGLLDQVAVIKYKLGVINNAWKNREIDTYLRCLGELL